MNSINSIGSSHRSFIRALYKVTIPNFTLALNTVAGQRVDYSNNGTFLWLSSVSTGTSYVVNNTPITGGGSANSPANYNNVPVRTFILIRNQTRDFYQDIQIAETGTYNISYWVSLNNQLRIWTGSNNIILTVYIDDTVVIPSYIIESGEQNWIKLSGTYVETVENSTRRLKILGEKNPLADGTMEARVNWTHITMEKTS